MLPKEGLERGKPPVYRNETIINPLKAVWLTANLPCSKRLKVMLPIWLPKYERWLILYKTIKFEIAYVLTLREGQWLTILGHLHR
jgi:hypothetical protein